MAEPNFRRRKLAAQRGAAFMVSVGADGVVDLTLYAGRRSLTRALSAQDVSVLVNMLIQTPKWLPELAKESAESQEVAHG